ncbi:hypothetical protein RQP54_01105 [Curvibacter sp. APW13]|uniref:hypothetical protein n=1 Tax=Curvibacter sp. APW13 TaxID=3077236 RepID=UPI0028DF8384|nr:hypothetical protein [Curvibacter sp. APW13]MDT8989454.1 hypothetical protein [Curvibacter sp. APW13]
MHNANHSAQQGEFLLLLLLADNSLNQHRTPFAELKHRALAALQSGFIASDIEHPHAAFARSVTRQRNLLKARSDARIYLPISELLRFEHWLMGEIELRSRSKDYRARLDVLYETPREVVVLPLHDSFQIALQLLDSNQVAIQDQLLAVRGVNKLIAENKLLEAEGALKAHREKFGASYWSAETEIALANVRATSEEVRTLQKQLSGNQRGLVRFFLSAAATRSDSAQLATRQLALLGRRIRNSDLIEPQKVHTQYRATATLPVSEDDLATIMAYELLLPPLDGILSAVSTAYALFARRASIDERTNAAVETLLSRYGAPFLSLPLPETSASGTVCSDLSRFIRGAVSSLLDRATQLSAGEIGLEAAIAAQLTGEDASAKERLHHFTACFPTHPWSIQLRPALPLQTLPQLVCDIAEQRSRSAEVPVHAQVARAFLNSVSGHEESAFKLLIDSIGCDHALGLLNDAAFLQRVENLSKTARDCLEVALAWALLRGGYPAEAMRVALHTGLRNQRVVESTPLVELFEAKSWKHLKHFDALLELSCALQLYHSATGDSQAKTTKRFAVSALMRREGCSDLVSLVSKLGASPNIEPRVLNFFVGQVLDLPLIELIGIADSTNAAQQELLNTLRAGSQLPDADVAGMEARIAEVEHSIAIAMARGTIDATKVFVSESELIHKAALEYRLTYEHYRGLVEERPLSEVDLDDILRIGPADLDADISDSQRLLREIFVGVLDMFLNDPSAGLDSVIGRRIRHGEITGALRGTLDHVGMISHRPKAGAPYEVSNRLADELSAYQPKQRTAVSAALSKFSTAIDNLCQVLCDDVFQCQRQNPTSRLRPAFALEVNARSLAGLLHLASQDQPFEEFVRVCFVMFWVSIYANIERERPVISAYVKKSLKDACTKLQTELKGLNLPDRVLIDRAQLATDKVLTKGETVLSWLAVPKADETSAYLRVSHVAYGTEMHIRGQHSDFEPEVSINAPVEALSLDNAMLLHDALYILFDNAAAHSKVARPDIRVTITADDTSLWVSFTCTIASAVFAELEAGRLAGVQSEIAARGAASVAKQNKGSGLGKLSSLTIGRGGQLSMTLDHEASTLVTKFALPLHISKRSNDELEGGAP